MVVSVASRRRRCQTRRRPHEFLHPAHLEHRPDLHRGTDGDDDVAFLERLEAGQLGPHRVLAGVEADEAEVAGLVRDLLLGSGAAGEDDRHAGQGAVLRVGDLPGNGAEQGLGLGARLRPQTGRRRW